MQTSTRLVSLLPMLKLNAEKFVSAMHALGQVRGSIKAQIDTLAEVHAWEPDEETIRFILEHVTTVRESAESLGAMMTIKAIANFVKCVNAGSVKTEASLQRLTGEIESRFIDELEDRYFFSLNSKEADAYTSDGFGQQVHDRFPSVIFELDEASKCMAFGRYTAAVFHLMRAVEVGLRATSLCLGSAPIHMGVGRSWGSVLTDLRSVRTGRPPTWPEHHFFSGVCAMLENIKHAWRDSTMHIENKYIQEEAEAIFVCARVFMEKLASRMDEAGQPRA